MIILQNMNVRQLECHLYYVDTAVEGSELYCYNTENQSKRTLVGLCGLGVTGSPRDPRFAGSNPAEFHEFLQDVKI